MRNQTLEQKANEKQGTKNIRTISRCHYCEKELQTPKDFHSLESNRQYNGFYKSPGGSPYCNKDHFTMFTED